MPRFRQAIFGKESGGRYDAVNPDSGALGIGQVMPENVGPWTLRYYGRRLTPQEYLKDTQAQDAVVNGHLSYLIQQQLLAGYAPELAIRRAASIWYSGRANLYNDSKKQFLINFFANKSGEPVKLTEIQDALKAAGVSGQATAWLKSLELADGVLKDVVPGNRRAGKKFYPRQVSFLKFSN